MDKLLIDALDNAKELLLGWLDDYNGVMTDAEGILADAFESIGFEEDMAACLAKIVFTFVI